MDGFGGESIVFAFSTEGDSVDRAAMELQHTSERLNIEDASSWNQGVKVQSIAASVKVMRQQLLNAGSSTTVLHISAHGHPGGLYLEPDDVYGSAFATIETMKYIIPRPIPLVVLAACHSEALGHELIEHSKAFRVIATTGAVKDTDVLRFTGAFYSRLCHGDKLITAFLYATQDLECPSIFTLLPELGAHDIHIFTPPTACSAVPTFLPPSSPPLSPPLRKERCFRPFRDAAQALTARIDVDGVCIVADEPGQGASSAALLVAHYLARVRKFPGGVFWAACGPQHDIDAPPTPLLSRFASTNDPKPLVDAPRLITPRPMEALATALGLESPDLEAMGSLLQQVSEPVLIVLDNVWPCMCFEGRTGCAAEDYCAMRVINPLISHLHRARCWKVKIMVTTSLYASELSSHAIYCPTAPASRYDRPAATLREEWAGVDTTRFVTTRVTRLSRQDSIDYLRDCLKETYGDTAVPTCAEWCWATVLGKRDGLANESDRVAFERYIQARPGRHADLPLPPSLQVPGLFSQVTVHIRNHLRESIFLDGNLRALTYLAALMENKRPIFSITDAELALCREHATNPSFAGQWAAFIPHGTTLVEAMKEALGYGVPSKTAVIADIPKQRPMFRQSSSCADPQNPAGPALPLPTPSAYGGPPLCHPTMPMMTPAPRFAAGTHGLPPRSAPAPAFCAASSTTLPCGFHDVSRAKAEELLGRHLGRVGLCLFRSSSEGGYAISLIEKPGSVQPFRHMALKPSPRGYKITTVAVPSGLKRDEEFPSVEAFISSSAAASLCEVLVPESPEPIPRAEFLRRFRAYNTPSDVLYAGYVTSPQIARPPSSHVYHSSTVAAPHIVAQAAVGAAGLPPRPTMVSTASTDGPMTVSMPFFGVGTAPVPMPSALSDGPMVATLEPAALFAAMNTLPLG